jgi:hypothetical protein
MSCKHPLPDQTFGRIPSALVDFCFKHSLSYRSMYLIHNFPGQHI